MRIDPPVLPLDSATFLSALRTGHGRALQHVSDFGARGLEGQIIEACTSCWAYDPQCEVARAPWLARIVERAGLQQEVLQAIGALAGSASPDEDWDLYQCCGVVKELASADVPGARPLLYSLLARAPGTADVTASAEIVALDGVVGLLHVARQLGRWLQEDPAFWVDGWLIKDLDQASGAEVGEAALEQMAASDPDIARYLAATREVRSSATASAERMNHITQTSAEVLAYVRSDPTDRCFWLRLWGARVSPEAHEEVFAALLDEDRPARMARLLRCFGRTGVPRFDEKLLAWIGHADESVRWPAIQAVAQLRHDRLREFALLAMAEKDPATGVRLLVANYQDGDLRLCEQHLDDPSDADEHHDLGRALLALCEAHRIAEAMDCLLYVYALSPCSSCRNSAVTLLIDLGVAPDWLLREAAFDVDPDTCALARGATP
jgi:hypothetical protein